MVLNKHSITQITYIEMEMLRAIKMLLFSVLVFGFRDIIRVKRTSLIGEVGVGGGGVGGTWAALLEGCLE